MNLRIILTVLIGFIAVATACGGANPTASSIPSPTHQASSDPTASPTPLKIDPAKLLEAQQHREEGERLKGEARYEEAIGKFDQAIQLDPGHPDSYNGRGMAYFNLGQVEQAVQDFDAAIGLDRQFAQAYNNRGVAYLRLGQNRNAIQDYTSAILYYLDYAEAYLNRGQAYYYQGDFEQAIKDFSDAITLDSELEVAYAGRALALTQLGRDEEAGKDLAHAVELGMDQASLEEMTEELKKRR